ncbi:hypothetical protein XI06_28310 [Bradyrhizobium sp. CCBAU 11434]|nr:hypothetical protein [Bradyrhizobium sp. CCBAU 11434]
MAGAIRTDTFRLRNRLRGSGSIDVDTVTAADIPFLAATVLTSISEMGNATRPGQYRLNFNRAGRGTTATITTIAAPGAIIAIIKEAAA